jgi:hypothetical protein
MIIIITYFFKKELFFCSRCVKNILPAKSVMIRLRVLELAVLKGVKDKTRPLKGGSLHERKRPF